MAAPEDSSLSFHQKAKPKQWSYILSHYKDVLALKAKQTRGNKKNGPEELIKLDNWYQETLPKLIHGRKEPHVTHEELVQITKWKLYRGKNRSRLLDLVRINTELAVTNTTKKAFKKASKDLFSAITALTNLKGIGPATASAVLAAGYPEYCPYMADECMLATPGVEATDYTNAEFINYAEQIIKCAERLNQQDSEKKWTPHKIELALWTHYVAKEVKPSIFDAMPLADDDVDEDDELKTHSVVEGPETVDTVSSEVPEEKSPPEEAEDLSTDQPENNSPIESSGVPATNGSCSNGGLEDQVSEESTEGLTTDHSQGIETSCAINWINNHDGPLAKKVRVE